MFGSDILAKEASGVLQLILRQHGKSMTWLTCSVIVLLIFTLSLPGASADGWFDPVRALRQVLVFLDVPWPEAGTSVVEWIRSDTRRPLMMGIAALAAIPCLSKGEFGEIVSWGMVLFAASALREVSLLLLFAGMAASLIIVLLVARASRNSGYDTGYHFLDSQGIFEVWMVAGPIRFALVPLDAPVRIWYLLTENFQIEEKTHPVATGAQVIRPGADE